MTDFFREVDEELRNERMKSIWNKYRFLLIGAVVLIILGTAAYRGYLYWVDSEAGKAGDQFLSAMEKIEEGDRAGADAILREMADDSFGKYPMLAKFRLASSKLAGGDSAGALSLFDELAKDSSVPEQLQNFAVLQGARIAVDTESYDAISARVGGILGEGSAWRDLAREVMVLSAWRGGNLTDAGKWIAEIKASSSNAVAVRERMRVIEDLIIARGGEVPSAPASN